MFDTHTHIFDEKLLEKIEQILEETKNLNFNGIICICENEKDVENFLKYYKNYEFLYCAVGIHPHNAKHYSENLLENLFNSLSVTNKLVAIGEIGLDFYYNFSSPQQQIVAFISQIEFAKNHSLPIIIHTRNSNQQVYEIIEKYEISNAVIHCMNNDLEFAKKVINKGLYLGFTGVITFKNSNYENLIKTLPNEKILVETDAPYLSPEPLRGRVNSPLNLKYIIEKIAQIKNLDFMTVNTITQQNAKNFFNIK